MLSNRHCENHFTHHVRPGYSRILNFKRPDIVYNVFFSLSLFLSTVVFALLFTNNAKKNIMNEYAYRENNDKLNVQKTFIYEKFH